MPVEIRQDGADQPLGIDAAVLIKALVLDRDQRLTQLVRNIVEVDPRCAVLLEEGVDAPGHVIDRRRDQEPDEGGDPEQRRQTQGQGDDYGNHPLPSRPGRPPHCGTILVSRPDPRDLFVTRRPRVGPELPAASGKMILWRRAPAG